MSINNSTGKHGKKCDRCEEKVNELYLRDSTGFKYFRKPHISSIKARRRVNLCL